MLTDSTHTALLLIKDRATIGRPVLDSEVHFAAAKVLLGQGLIEVAEVYASGARTFRPTEAGKALIEAKGYPTTVTFPEGYVTRVSAQTASRDYSGTVTPGTYPIEYVNIQHQPVAPEQGYYAYVKVQITVQDRTQSTVEFGGVAYGHETIPAHTEEHYISWYAYEVQGRITGRYNDAVVYGYQNEEVSA